MTHTTWGLATVTCLFLAGCGTPAANPAKPHAKMGYVDFYTDSNLELSWDIKRSDQPGDEMRKVYSKFEPLEGTVLRLACPPGNWMFQVWIMNRVTDGPQTLAVRVENGKVTPVHVTLNPAGTTSVDRKVYGFRPSAKGYGRGTKIVTEENEVYRVVPAAEAPRNYQPMERMPYFRSEPK